MPAPVEDLSLGQMQNVFDLRSGQSGSAIGIWELVDLLFLIFVTSLHSNGVYRWHEGDAPHELKLIPVPGTQGMTYLFGAEPNRRPIGIRDFLS